MKVLRSLLLLGTVAVGFVACETANADYFDRRGNQAQRYWQRQGRQAERQWDRNSRGYRRGYGNWGRRSGGRVYIGPFRARW